MKITIDRKFSVEEMKQLCRWHCECGRVGVWLEHEDVARSNGADHDEYEHPPQEAA